MAVGAKIENRRSRIEVRCGGFVSSKNDAMGRGKVANLKRRRGFWVVSVALFWWGAIERRSDVATKGVARIARRGECRMTNA